MVTPQEKLSYAAGQMVAATGKVPGSTWEQISARESNAANILQQNGPGASGLFETMPGWGSLQRLRIKFNQPECL